jgi:predicted RNase H-like HicB family nuclease
MRLDEMVSDASPCTIVQLVLSSPMHLRIETELEDDGRWLAEIPQLPGVLAYGTTAKEASAKAETLALRVLAERLEHDEAAGASRR